MTRQLLLKLSSVCFALAALLSTARGGIPAMEVTVFDATEKVVCKRALDANGTFATDSLPSGSYVVQFKTKNSTVRANQYLLVVAAGKKKVIADSVAGDLLSRGGAAMKIQVGAGLPISGQVLNDDAIAQAGGPKYRTVEGKRYVWVSNEIGTNITGHWEDVSTGPKRTVIVWTRDEIQKRMDRGGEGSMITYDHHHGLFTHGY